MVTSAINYVKWHLVDYFWVVCYSIRFFKFGKKFKLKYLFKMASCHPPTLFAWLGLQK